MARAKSDKADKKADPAEVLSVTKKEQDLTSALADIGKRFGPEAIMRLGADNVVKCDVISTGSLGLDAAIGVGGIPKGRIVEFYGPESSGKTTLALHCVANSQKDGGVAAFIDAEHALDPSYARKLGVNLDTLLVSQPDSGEQALEICEMLVRSNAVDVIVIDSVAALTPKAELEGDMGQSHVGLQARLMSQGLRKLTGIVKKSNTCIIFINQIRMKIGVMFGSPETTTGGNALKFYSSVRLDIRRTQAIKKGDEILGSDTKVKVVKNKMAPPFKIAQFQVLFNKGVNRLGEVVDLGSEHGIIEKTGSWFSYGDMRIGQGRDKAIDFLQDNPDIAGEIENKLKSLLFDNVIVMEDPQKEEKDDQLELDKELSGAPADSESGSQDSLDSMEEVA
ncbi:MAG: recombinase RecA [Planctomycetes bacterium]|nr:recombinase RecA [Planctomycetota bacterium]MCC8115585.1 recombinase RecA [Planctomycetota bacterium]